MAGIVNDVTDTTWQSEVLEADKPVLVDFWAPWCAPCRVVSPVIEEIAAERQDALKVVKVNVDENPQIASDYQVMSLPTFMVFKHGQVTKKTLGNQPKRKLVSELALDEAA